MARIGGNSQDRRRTRRAAERRVEATRRRARIVSVEDREAFADLVAAASGSSSLPLSDRNRTWDASAAEGRVRSWADAEEGPNAKYASAFFVKQGDGSKFGDYKLGYADVVDGKLTAVWKGITAVAGVLQGARGGVQASDAEKASARSKVESYYAKARKAYDDDSIKVPWAADGENSLTVEETAIRLTLAELGLGEGMGEVGEPVEMQGAAADEAQVSIPVRFIGQEAYLERYGEWLVAFGVATPEEVALALLERLAVGDVAWGPEEGFVDLIADLNQMLHGVDGDAEAESSYGMCCVVIDVSVRLDKALIVDYDEGCCYVAALRIDGDGEPQLADRTEWAPVEDGMIEVAPDTDEDGSENAAAIRLRLSDFSFADTQDAMLPEQHRPNQRQPRRRPGPSAPAPAQSAKQGPAEWNALFVPEAFLTEDRRAFAPDSIGWRELPLSLAAMTKTADGHDGAEVCGRIDKIWREGNLIKASGVFDEGEYGQEIARMVADGTLRGLSVDIAPLEWERTPRSDWFDDDGVWIAERDEDGVWAPTVQENRSVDEAHGLLFDEDAITVITKGVIGMATVCPFPAFADANISLVASGVLRFTHQGGFIVVQRESESLVAAAVAADEDAEEGEQPTVLTAAAAGHAPLLPPADWFDDPGLEEPTALTIDEDGRVFGHAWTWGTCHLAFDQCVQPPESATDYAFFHLGEIECDDGERLSVGKVTLDAPHAGQRLTREGATRHYDHTGTVVAHVRVGEDEHGGWVAGAISPDLPDEKLRLLRGSTLSGDWRGVDGNLELVALLAVNVPGFPVPRTRAALVADAGGKEEILALTAAGIVVRRDPVLDELAAAARG